MSASGYDRAEFLVRTNPGITAGTPDEGRLRRRTVALSSRRSKSASPSAAPRRLSSSTRSTPASAARSRTPWVSDWPDCRSGRRCSRSLMPLRSPRGRRAISASPRATRRRRSGRHERLAPRGGPAARGDRSHARRRGNHPGGARGRREPDRKGWMTAENQSILPAKACSAWLLGPIKRRVGPRVRLTLARGPT